MQHQDSSLVSPWVRNAIPIVACLSMLALIYSAYNGKQLPWQLIVIVGGFASGAMFYAFRR